MEKVYLTIEDQIQYLKNKKNIIVPDINVFYERTYTSIVNPYKRLFACGETKDRVHEYKDEVLINSLLLISKVDDEVSSDINNAIRVFERKLKTQIFTKLCDLAFKNGDVYCNNYCLEFDRLVLDIENNDSSVYFDALDQHISSNGSLSSKNSELFIKTRKDVLKKIVAIGKGEEKWTENNIVNHYQKGEIMPLWIVLHSITFGELCILFNMMHLETKRQIVSAITSKKCMNISPKDVVSFSGKIEQVRNIRNIINHYENLYPYINQLLMGKSKNSQKLTATIDLLVKVQNENICSNVTGAIEFSRNSYNEKHIKNFDKFRKIMKKDEI